MDPIERQAPQVVIRSGGLGDFILTLPLLAGLKTRGHVFLITRPSYARLIWDDDLFRMWLSIDSPLSLDWENGDPAGPAGLIEDAWVHDFLGGHAKQARAAGASGYGKLESRPTEPPHVTARMLRATHLEDRVPLNCSWLARRTRPERPCLWIHPGSGSLSKNADMQLLARVAADWLERQSDREAEIILSFGEADMQLLPAARHQFAELPVLYRVQPSLEELRREMTERATQYLGNDTGVSHLAAALDIPTTVYFCRTDPAIWLPVGRQVRAVGPETLVDGGVLIDETDTESPR